jgi:hypothetical protein
LSSGGPMEKRIGTIAALVLGLALAGGARGQDVESLKKKQQELEKQVTELQDQVRQVKKALSAGGDVAGLEKGVMEARRAYEAKLKGAEKVVAAKKAADAADGAEKKAVDAGVGQDKDAQAILARGTANDQAIAAMDKERRAAQAKLLEVRKRIVAEPGMVAAAQGAKKADEAVLDLPRTDAKLMAAGKAVEEARKALEEKIKTLPEKAALDAATKAYEETMKGSPELAAAKKARDAAKAELEEKVRAKIAEDAQGAAELKTAAELKEKIGQARTGGQKIDAELGKIKQKLEKEDAKMIEARKAAEVAHAAYRKAIEEELKGEKAAVASAEKAYNDALEAKVAVNPKAMAARKEIEDLDGQLRGIRDEIRKGGK